MKKLDLNYEEIVAQADSLNNAEEKINYLQKVLGEIDDFYSSRNFIERKEIPEEKLQFFEKINLKALIRTRIFFEELKSTGKHII